MSGEASRSVSPGGDLLERAVARYHEILASIDTAESVAHTRDGFERANLIFGGRPLSPYLRPHFVTAADWERIKQVCEAMWSCVQKVGHAAAADPALQGELGLTDAERQLLAIDPGYDYISPSARLDSFLTGDSYAFVELNAECPAGIAYADVATSIFLEHPAMRKFCEEFHVEPLHARDRMLETLLAVWRQVRPDSGAPSIAIVDWEGLPTQAEFELFKAYFEEAGYPTTIADPRALTFEGGRLRHGDFEIDLVYKRLLTNDFLEHIDELDALHRAYAERAIVMVNSFRGKYVHKKMFFGVLTNERYAGLFTDEERRAIAAHVPWTRRVADVRTEYKGEAGDLVAFVRANRDRLVMKPNDDYGGHGVFLGWETSADDWERAIARALERPYVVQQRVPLKKVAMPTFSGGLRLDEVFVDFNPFLFHNEVEGALIRLSSSSLLNVTSGGGQTALLVLEDM